MTSPLMSEAEAIAYLGLSGRPALTRLVRSGKLSRDPITGAFARAQVYDLALQRARAMGYGNVEQAEATMASERGYRSRTNVVL